LVSSTDCMFIIFNENSRVPSVWDTLFIPSLLFWDELLLAPDLAASWRGPVSSSQVVWYGNAETSKIRSWNASFPRLHYLTFARNQACINCTCAQCWHFGLESRFQCQTCMLNMYWCHRTPSIELRNGCKSFKDRVWLPTWVCFCNIVARTAFSPWVL
jgi:hypothetical protein